MNMTACLLLPLFTFTLCYVCAMCLHTLCISLTQVVNQNPVFVLLLLFAISLSAASRQLLHVVPKQSAGKPLEHAGVSCEVLRLKEEQGSGRRRGGLVVTLVISCVSSQKGEGSGTVLKCIKDVCGHGSSKGQQTRAGHCSTSGSFQRVQKYKKSPVG